MKVQYGKEFKSDEGSKTRKVVGLFMVAALAMSTGYYLIASPRQDDQDDNKDQSVHFGGGGGGYYNSSSSKTGEISEGVAPVRGGIGSSATGGAE